MTRSGLQTLGETLKSSVSSAPSTTGRATAAEAELAQEALGMPPVPSSGREGQLLGRWSVRQSLNLSPGIFGGSWATRRLSRLGIRWQSGVKSLRRFVALLRGTRRPASRYSHE